MSDEVANQNLQMQHMQMQQQQLQQQQLQLHAFWQEQNTEIQNVDPATHHFKQLELPLARIKKIMKADEEVKMISSEAPVLFAKAAEMFILELTLRSWIHTEENKRRTLQRNDIAMAITKTDTFDFLIDIVPRDDIKPTKKPGQDQAMYQNAQMQAVLMQQYMAANPNWAAQMQQAQMAAGAAAAAGNSNQPPVEAPGKGTVDV